MIGSEYCRFWRARLGFPTSKSQSRSPNLYSCFFSLLCSPPSSPSPSISGWKLISSLIWKCVLMRSTSSLYFVIAFPHPLHLALLLIHRLHVSRGICLLHVKDKCDPNYRVERATRYEWLHTKPYFFSFIPSCFLSFLFFELKTLLRANDILCVAMRNSGDIKKEDPVLVLLELWAPLGTHRENEPVSTEAGNTDEPSVSKETANSEVWMQHRIWRSSWRRRTWL